MSEPDGLFRATPEVPMGVCGKCGRSVRAWSLQYLNGFEMCLECRTAEGAKRKRLLSALAAAGIVAAVVVAVFGATVYSRAQASKQDYEGSPRESMDKLVDVARSDPQGVNQSYNLMLYGTTGSAKDAVNGGPIATYADLVTIRKQLESAEAGIHQQTGVVQISEYFEFGNLTMSTVLGAAKTMEFSDETANSARGTAVFKGPTVGLDREYTATFTLAKSSETTATVWRIISLDNPSDVIRTYVGD